MTNDKKGINPATVGLAGIVIGAAAGAAAVALSDKDNRKKFQKTVTDLKTEGSKRLDEWKNKAKDLEQDAKKQLASAKSNLKKSKTDSEPETAS